MLFKDFDNVLLNSRKQCLVDLASKVAGIGGVILLPHGQSLKVSGKKIIKRLLNGAFSILILKKKMIRSKNCEKKE